MSISSIKNLFGKLIRLERNVFHYNLSKDFDRYYLYKKPVDRELNIDATQLPPAIKKHFLNGISWNREFCYHYPYPCHIESTKGFAIAGKRTLIKESLYRRYLHQRKKPSYLKYLWYPKKKFAEGTAIGIQYGADNYWHFYNDILGAVQIAEQLHLTEKYPILLPEKLLSKSYFQGFINISSKLASLNFRFQKKRQTLSLESAYFISTAWSHRRNFDFAISLINTDIKNAIIRTTSKKADQKIFLTRSKRWVRTITNLDEIEKIAESMGFSIVDCDELTVQEQVQVFSNANACIGIHGAALTNIIYRSLVGQMHVFEILPAIHHDPAYFLIANEYRYSYTAILVKCRSILHNYYLEPKRFEQAVEKWMLQHSIISASNP